MLLVMLLPSGILARDFTYTHQGQTLKYTVIDEIAKTCMTKAGRNKPTPAKPGNKCMGKVIIPSKAMDGVNEYPITKIGEYGFYSCSGLTSVTIPNSVTSISESAFADCSGLTSVDIPNSVKLIGKSSFNGCSGLTSVDIPYSVITIGDYAFRDCRSLSTIKFSNSVTSIGDYAFQSCSSLTSVDIPNIVKLIGHYAFKGCKIDFRFQPKSYLKVIDDSGKEVPLSEAAEIDKDYKYKWDGNTVTFTGLHPTQGVSFKVFGCTVYGSTSNIDITLRQVEKYADIAVVEASFGYEELVENYYFYQSVGGKKYEQKKIAVPYGNGSKITFYISGDGFQNSKDLNLGYSTPKFSE